MKLCKDCKWMREPGEFAKCVAPRELSVPIRTGFETPPVIHCSTARDDIARYNPELCGPDGNLWEPME